MLKKHKTKQPEDSKQELKQIVELLEKLVYLQELSFKSAGVTIKYPGRVNQ